MCGGTAPDHHSHSLCVEVKLLASPHCASRFLAEVVKVSPLLMVNVFVDHSTAFLEGRNKELPSITGKLLREMRVEVKEKGLKQSITEGGKEGKSNVIASCSCLEEKFQECCRRDRVRLAIGVETLGEDLRTRMKQLGAKSEGEKENVRWEIQNLPGEIQSSGTRTR